MTNQPVGHEAAVAAAGDAYALLVDVAATEQRIKAIHDIDGVLFAPGSAHGQGKFIPIATATTRIGIEDDIALRDEHLHLVEEAIPVLRLWPAVDLDDEGILFGRIEVGWFQYPAIHVPAIGTFVGHIFRRR